MLKKINKKAFTLVELLIVMTIIGVLSSMVLIVSNNSQSKAKNKNLENLTESLGTSMNVYYFKNGKYPSSH